MGLGLSSAATEVTGLGTGHRVALVALRKGHRGQAVYPSVKPLVL